MALFHFAKFTSYFFCWYGLISTTTFSHTSHFSLLDEEGCTSCHSLNEKADFISGYKDRDFRTFTSNFNLVSKDTCAECHSNTSTSAGNYCITCHNYHIGKFPPTVPSAPIVMTKKEKRVKLDK